MKRRPLVSQGSLSRLLQTAEQAWKDRDFEQNIDVLERASRLDPANPRILLQLGRVYGLRYNFAAAERCFEKVIRVVPSKVEAFIAAGYASRDFHNPELAKRYFESAVEQKDASPEAFTKLAELYERLRRPDEADKLLNRALHVNATYAPALLVRARLARQADRLEEAEKLLRSFVANAEKEIRIRGLYQLGGVLDRQGRYDDAMAAFLEAKSLLRPDAPPFTAQLQKLRAHLNELRESITAEILQRWFQSDQAFQPSRRLVLLCGHPRSGTTLLEQVLDSHPDIISAEETEIFHDDAYFPLRRNFPITASVMSVLESTEIIALQRSRENYFRITELSLGQPVGNRLLIDKNPSLTFLIPHFIRIFPETKFLVALRDPRDVCLSCFMQPFVPISRTNSAYLNLESTAMDYAALMNMWRTVSPLMKNPYIELRYEDMVNDLESASRRATDFMNVPWDPRVLKFHERSKEKMVRSVTYADVTKPVFKRAVGRWQNYQKYLEPHLHILAPFAKAFGYE